MANLSHSRCSNYTVSHPTLKCFKQQIKVKYNKKFSSYFNSRNPKNKCNERNNQKPNVCFRCVSEDHWVADCPKPKKSKKRVQWNTENTKTCVYKLTKIEKSLYSIKERNELHKMYL